MKKIIVLLLLVFLGMTESHAQGWEWMKPLGYDDISYSGYQISKSRSGNLLINCVSIVGSTYDTDLILCNANGDTLWKKKYPGLKIEDVSFDQIDNMYFSGSFADTILVDGTSISSTGTRDAIIGKLDLNGNYITHVSFGSASPESAYSLVLNNNKLFVVGTFANSFSFGGSAFSASGAFRTYVMKLDTAFNLIKTFQTDSSAMDAVGLKLRMDQNGSVYIMGKGEGFIRFGNSTIYLSEGGQFLAKLSNELENLWAKTITLHYMHGYYLRNILFDKYQNVVMAQKTGGGGGASHHLKINKFDSLGYHISNKMTPVNDEGFMAIDTSDNVWVAGRDYAFSGTSRFSICKVSPSNVADTLFYDTSVNHEMRGFEVNDDGGFYMLGKNHPGSYLGPFSCPDDGVGFLARYGQGLVTQVQPLTSTENFMIYPNPSRGIFTLELSDDLKQSVQTICVYDVLGRCILTQSYSNEANQQIDISEAGKGVYFVEVETEGSRINKKIVLN